MSRRVGSARAAKTRDSVSAVIASPVSTRWLKRPYDVGGLRVNPAVESADHSGRFLLRRYPVFNGSTGDPGRRRCAPALSPCSREGALMATRLGDLLDDARRRTFVGRRRELASSTTSCWAVRPAGPAGARPGRHRQDHSAAGILHPGAGRGPDRPAARRARDRSSRGIRGRGGARARPPFGRDGRRRRAVRGRRPAGRRLRAARDRRLAAPGVCALLAMRGRAGRCDPCAPWRSDPAGARWSGCTASATSTRREGGELLERAGVALAAGCSWCGSARRPAGHGAAGRDRRHRHVLD